MEFCFSSHIWRCAETHLPLLCFIVNHNRIQHSVKRKTKTTILQRLSVHEESSLRLVTSNCHFFHVLLMLIPCALRIHSWTILTTCDQIGNWLASLWLARIHSNVRLAPERRRSCYWCLLLIPSKRLNRKWWVATDVRKVTQHRTLFHAWTNYYLSGVWTRLARDVHRLLMTGRSRSQFTTAAPLRWSFFYACNSKSGFDLIALPGPQTNPEVWNPDELITTSLIITVTVCIHCDFPDKPVCSKSVPSSREVGSIRAPVVLSTRDGRTLASIWVLKLWQFGYPPCVWGPGGIDVMYFSLTIISTYALLT